MSFADAREFGTSRPWIQEAGRFEQLRVLFTERLECRRPGFVHADVKDDPLDGHV